jgi:ubiquinone/menaquinone biosynthesis C-methylase UbiE
MPEHYSYTHYASTATAATFDAARFGGPIGELLAETQERVLREFLGDVRGRSVLDVGTGTGRGALALARLGAVVTGIDASDAMLDVARERAARDGLSVQFQVGDAHALPFQARSFDFAISLRVLMHAPDWRRCLRELCRVSRSRVVIDYPSAFSVAAAQSASRHIAQTFGRQVEAYRVLRFRSIANVFEEQEFRITRQHRQFVLPIAFHKLAESRGFTEGVEGLLARVGLLRLFGSPVTVVAQRQ